LVLAGILAFATWDKPFLLGAVVGIATVITVVLAIRIRQRRN